jgi:hypothetical protein
VNVDNWLGALRSAAAAGQHSLVLDCAESMHWFYDRWARAPHWHEVVNLGAGAAAALGCVLLLRAALPGVTAGPPVDLRHDN